MTDLKIKQFPEKKEIKIMNMLSITRYSNQSISKFLKKDQRKLHRETKRKYIVPVAKKLGD